MRRPISITIIALGLTWLSPAAAEESFVGVEGCRTCHPQAYQHWRATPHARAFERLVGPQRSDPNCTQCHATDAKSGRLGVQCESCHGAGEHYWPAYIMADHHLAVALGLRRGDEPQMCLRCHTEEQPSLVPFDLQAALRRVQHGPIKRSKGER